MNTTLVTNDDLLASVLDKRATYYRELHDSALTSQWPDTAQKYADEAYIYELAATRLRVAAKASAHAELFKLSNDFEAPLYEIDNKADIVAYVLTQLEERGEDGYTAELIEAAVERVWFLGQMEIQ
jgi:hypothetical protein